VPITIDSIVLRGGETTLTLQPALGGKISALHVAGREWLWTSDIIAHRVPDDAMRADDVSYVRMADTGGYDECFPTVGACTVPENVPSFAGLRLPDHGELWSQVPTIDIRRAPDGDHVSARWTGSRMPYVFTRVVHVTHGGSVTMRYSAVNHGTSPLPFLWSAHPLLPLTDRTRIHLPRGARLRVDVAHGFATGGAHPPMDGAGGSAFGDQRWPIVSIQGVTVDASHPASIGDGRACKLFLDLPAGPMRASVEEGGARLDVHLDASRVTHFGLWLNNRGWTPFENGRPYRNLAFEPCIGAADSLARALGDWSSAAWLAPGETREWTLTWSGSRA
jgi:galactose mutarotase-like enzyme